MQTRKRAKSISFGKKPKEKVEEKEQEVVHKAAEAETPVTKEESSKEVEAKETPAEEPKETVKESKADDKEKEEPLVVTPQEDFLTDASPAAEEETKEESKEEAVKEEVEEEKPSDNILSDNLSSVPESVSPEPEEKKESSESDDIAQPVVVDHNEQPKEDTATQPQSAFSLQGGDEKVESSSDDGGKKKFGLYFFIVALLSFILGLGAMAAVTYFGLLDISLPKQLPFGNVNISSLPGAKATPTPVKAKPTVAAATPTSAPVDKTAYTIAVLNGSGISGKAATVQSDLTRAGFTVSTTGNADRSTYTTTQITVKQKVSDGYIAELQKELEKEYTLAKVSRVPDTSAQATDVVIILGSQGAN